MKRSFVAMLAILLTSAPLVAAAAAPSPVEARLDRSHLRRGESVTLQLRLRGEAADERPVITSYSIHYTKLYDSRVASWVSPR